MKHRGLVIQELTHHARGEKTTFRSFRSRQLLIELRAIVCNFNSNFRRSLHSIDLAEIWHEVLL